MREVIRLLDAVAGFAVEVGAIVIALLIFAWLAIGPEEDEDRD